MFGAFPARDWIVVNLESRCAHYSCVLGGGRDLDGHSNHANIERLKTGWHWFLSREPVLCGTGVHTTGALPNYLQYDGWDWKQEIGVA